MTTSAVEMAPMLLSDPNPPTRLRSYQTEMLHASLQKNVIVSMDTGSGKTQVAVSRIRLELEQVDDKFIWFLTPSKTLAEQQYQVLLAELSGFGVRLLTGADGCDKWSDQHLWDAFLAGVRVVVATPAILLDALSHGFMHLSRCALLVFDEAHHCTKKHPMSSIMKLFYHPAREHGEPLPHILGLSASPVVNSKQGMLQTIEGNLNSIAVTPKEHRHELEQYVNPPEVKTIVYSASEHAGPAPLCANLAQITRTYNLSTDPYVLGLTQQDDEKSRKELATTKLRRRTFCLDQLRALDARAGFLMEQIGGEMADWYVDACIKRFKASLISGNTVLPDLSEQERQHLARIFDTLGSLSSTMVGTSRFDITPKAAQLVNILVKHADTALRGIVFVEQRVLVTALAELLTKLPELSKHYRIAAFVGTSVSSNRKISVADLVALRDQQSDLDAFRNGEKNLMIATNVLEEGIDVSACNVVICFDPPKNLVSFVQRRGRARQYHSKYFLFASEAELTTSNKPWAELEAEMRKIYMDETRQLGEYVDDDDSEDERKLYQVPSTGAVLSLDNAKSHLYHFCSVCLSQSSQHVDLRPEFDTNQNGATKLWKATVHLPAFVHPEFRTAESVREWPREDVAIKDAAFEAYVALHKAGLVNDNLLPLNEEHSSEDSGQIGYQPSLVSASDRPSVWKPFYADEGIRKEWSQWTVNVKLNNTTIVEMSMWLPATQVANIEAFELFWNEDTKYTVTVYQRELQSLEVEEIALLRQCTHLMLHTVHGSRMSADTDDFPFLFAPSAIPDLQQWLAQCSGQEPASRINPSSGEPGLVRVSGQTGRSYFHRETLDGVNKDMMTVTSFPKRRDFLHPLASGGQTKAAYTAKEQVPIRDCTTDRLPARFALFAALVPSILHRVDTTLAATTLQCTILEGSGIVNSSLVLEAISSPAAGELNDYNRLEYIGDTVLKHCTEIQVMAQHLKKPEAFLTMERDKLVRNSNLARAALKAGLDKFVLTRPFTGAKWRPPLVSEIVVMDTGTREMSTKTLADVVESLIGAAYVDGGIAKALLCIKTLLPANTWHSPVHCFETLESHLSSKPAPGLDLLEKLVGHKFKHTQLLLEAITHVSFPYNETGMSYERLEFLGDSVLDMVVTPKLFKHSSNLRHWQLHRFHEALVNGHFLGYCCMAYATEESQNDIDTTAEGQHRVISKSRKVHLHDFLRAGAQTMQTKHKSILRFKELAEDVTSIMQQGTRYPWVELVSLTCPKFFSDMVESVLGALYLDSGGDLAVCEAFVERLGIMSYMRRILDDNVDCLHPKEKLGMLADQEPVKYLTRRIEDDEGRKVSVCTVMVGNTELLTVDSCTTKEEAEVKAAYEACQILQTRDIVPKTDRKRKLDVAEIEDARDEQSMEIDIDSEDSGI